MAILNEAIAGSNIIEGGTVELCTRRDSTSRGPRGPSRGADRGGARVPAAGGRLRPTRGRAGLMWTRRTGWALAAMLACTQAGAIEEAEYRVIRAEKPFEVREYAPQIIAEVTVDGPFDEAADQAFSLLFAYISGANVKRGEIAMTAPVSQTAEGEKIAMTAPVEQREAGERWSVSFLMPAAYTLDTLPRPTDSRVTIRSVPARRMAAIRYSGTWSERRYREHHAALQSWMAERGLRAGGEAIWARYNPPFTPWFLRRNEILVPLPSTDP